MKLVHLAAGAAIVVLPRVAFAQAEPAPAGAPPPPSYPIEGAAPAPTATDPRGDDRRHDGFYLRFGVGLGWLSLKRDTETTTVGTDVAFSGESTIRGGVGVGEISIGGTVGTGIVLCGTLLGHELADATLEREDGDDVELGEALSLGLIGMGIHYFPDEYGGFHVGGTAGLAYAVADAPASRFERLGGVGLGVSLATGYDWWIGDQWALGVIGRFTGARVHGEATDDGVTAEEDDTAAAFAVMFSVLHH